MFTNWKNLLANPVFKTQQDILDSSKKKKIKTKQMLISSSSALLLLEMETV